MDQWNEGWIISILFDVWVVIVHLYITSFVHNMGNATHITATFVLINPIEIRQALRIPERNQGWKDATSHGDRSTELQVRFCCSASALNLRRMKPNTARFTEYIQ